MLRNRDRQGADASDLERRTDRTRGWQGPLPDGRGSVLNVAVRSAVARGILS